MRVQVDMRPNLYLTGFMGTGKSAVGRLLAESLGLRFIDADSAIEVVAGKRVAEIFAESGETTFRELEQAFVENGHPEQGCVVACGGGLIVQPGMVERLRAKGMIVVLWASPETIYERTRHNTQRPLLQVENPLERIRELLAEREAVYREAGVQVMTDCRTTREVAACIERHYRQYAKQHQG